VVGGGDTALEDANYLANICEKVYIIHRRESFRAAKSLQEKVFEHENVEVIWNSVVEEIKGNDRVERISVKNTVMDMSGDIDSNAVFIAIGTRPQSELLKGKVELTDDGYVNAGEDGRTGVRGIYAAGDVRKKPLRQIITAVSDGANAINSVLADYL
jgi:thioredoxin reductase (NADPH)